MRSLGGDGAIGKAERRRYAAEQTSGGKEAAQLFVPPERTARYTLLAASERAGVIACLLAAGSPA